MLLAAAEREHNDFAIRAKLQGADGIDLIFPPGNPEELKEAALDDEEVRKRAERAPTTMR